MESTIEQMQLGDPWHETSVDERGMVVCDLESTTVHLFSFLFQRIDSKFMQMNSDEYCFQVTIINFQHNF